MTAALALLLVHGCSGAESNSEVASPGPEEAAESVEAAGGSAEVVPEAPEAPPEEAAPEPAGQIRGDLGSARVAIVENADRVQSARMGRRCLRDGEEPEEGQEYFVGCPLTAPLLDLDSSAPETRALMAAVLDDESYRFGVRVRCNTNHDNVGLRFTRGEEHVDYSLVSCQTGFLVIDGDEEGWVGAVSTEEHRARLVAAAPAE